MRGDEAHGGGSAALAQGDWTAASEDAEIHRIAAATFADLKDHLGLTT